MVFSLLKAYARLAIEIFCRKIIINNPEWLNAKGPLLLACNHPNSFLDGVILTILFEHQVYSLARGDAFKNKKHNRLLRWLHLLPVYRTSEGVENLEHNYTTFAACKKIFDEGGIVIIFSEGRCINEWHLRPLKKGTARLAIDTWDSGINLTVLPVGLNYNSFRSFGKNVVINFGKPLQTKPILAEDAEGRRLLGFNAQLKNELHNLVLEIDPADKISLKQNMVVPLPYYKRIFLALPALCGLLLHAPFYFLAKKINGIYFNNDHYDSTLVGMLTLAYPFYLLLIVVVAGFYFNWSVALLLIIVVPFTAWACVQLKPQLN